MKVIIDFFRYLGVCYAYAFKVGYRGLNNRYDHRKYKSTEEALNSDWERIGDDWDKIINWR